MHNIKLVVSSSPHIKDRDNVTKIMLSVVIALIPTVLSGIFFFGLKSLIILLTTISSSLITEVIFQKVRKKPITLRDGSGLVTGLLLGLTLPPNLPIWMAVVGGVVSIGLGKMVFGGLGQNIFNPALIGRAFLLITFPVKMTEWLAPLDGVSAATPLNLLKMQGIKTNYFDLLIGNVGGSIGETSAIFILIGGLYLLYRKCIDWRIPVSYLGTVFIMTLLLGQDPIFHLLSGGLMLGAFFMATDMVTTPITKKGRWIFGIGAGIILVIIRVYGGYPEGVLYSILFMNGLTPIINRYTRSKIFGEVAK
ncbi:electron transporter RnfD [Caloranaerobacter sp. TR13]|uniref:RnfABCDGE type electron transport complex subunit D n=1 Tax=Caloranaerobacter sp. TR13 TaxID=1302151 RepID=UPI0006D493D6|nr:RnfABCDGE type electron transport complex subunit D [Caloranaerobacter sp. TR13]KPU26516.1 electron transporter RnfD [Caloranaerobacter sp. TR13]